MDTTKPVPGGAVVAHPRLTEMIKVSEKVRARLHAEDRAQLDKLTHELSEYMDHPIFAERGVERALMGTLLKLPRTGPAVFDGMESIFERIEPAARGNLLSQHNLPTLSAKQEQHVFQVYNYARFRMAPIAQGAMKRAISMKGMRDLLAWARLALQARSRIVQINMPLVLAMAKRTRLGGVDFNELISEGNMALLRSVDKFDCNRGFKFSTYACRAILKSFSRVAMRASRYHGRFPVEYDPTMEKSDYLDKKRESVEISCIDEIRQILEENLANLSGVEQRVIRERFAMTRRPGTQPPQPKTLEQVGQIIGVTKERVRQIQNKALAKIKSVLEENVLAA